MDAGTSRSGDYGLVVFEFDFASELKVLADDFKVRVTSLNGEVELYEWAFITLGDMSDAPFSINDIISYSPLDYHGV